MFADVDDFEPDPRRARRLSAQHPPDDLDGAQVVGREDGSEHRAGEDRGERRRRVEGSRRVPTAPRSATVFDRR